PDQRAIWDAFVAGHPHGHLLQSWAWGDLKDAFGWRTLRVALWDADGQHILAGAQVLCRPLPVLPLSIAYIPKGPIIDWADDALCRRFFQSLHPLLRVYRVAFLRIDPDLPAHIAEVIGDDENESTGSSNAADAEVFGNLYSVAQGSLAFQQLR